MTKYLAVSFTDHEIVLLLCLNFKVSNFFPVDRKIFH